MTTSSTVSAGDQILASQYNNLRTDALSGEVFYAMNATGGVSKGDYSTSAIASGGLGATHVTGYIPADASTIDAIVLVAIPGSNNNASWNIDLASDYAAVDEGYQTHSESDTSTTYDLSTADDNVKEIDVSGVFGSLAGGDYFGLKITNNEADTLNVLGVRVAYSG